MASTAQLRFHSARLVSVIGALEASPALLTKVSIPPNARVAWRNCRTHALLVGYVHAHGHRAPRAIGGVDLLSTLLHAL